MTEAHVVVSIPCDVLRRIQAVGSDCTISEHFHCSERNSLAVQSGYSLQISRHTYHKDHAEDLAAALSELLRLLQEVPPDFEK